METLLSTIGKLIARGDQHQAALIALIGSVSRTPAAAGRPGVSTVCAMCADPTLSDHHERLAGLLLELLAAPDRPRDTEKPKKTPAPPCPVLAQADLPSAAAEFMEQVRDRILPQGPVPSVCTEAGTISTNHAYRAPRNKHARAVLMGQSGPFFCLCAPLQYDAVAGKWPDDQIQGLSAVAGHAFPSELILVFPVVGASQYPETAQQWATAAEVRILQFLGTIIPPTFMAQKVAVRIADVDGPTFNAYKRMGALHRFDPLTLPRMFQTIAETTVLRARKPTTLESAPKRVHASDANALGEVVNPAL